MPSVRKARQEGILAICRGTTTAFVAEELEHSTTEKGNYVAGYIGPKGLSVNPKLASEMIFKDGELKAGLALADVVKDMRKGDVIVKGANALGSDWIAANLIGRQNEATTAGTMGVFQMVAMARGFEVIVPVGLEKCIPVSILEASEKLSSSKVDYSTGVPCGLIPIFGTIVTEVEALESVADVEVMPIAAGGIGGAEGCIVLLIEGEMEQIKLVMDLAEYVKDEPLVGVPHSATG